jgi:hypothetical protein
MTSVEPIIYPPYPPPPPPAPAPRSEENAGLLDYSSKEFGLTNEEYEILLDDIELAIQEGNRKYGYSSAGYLADDGSYYLPKPTKQFIDHTTHRRKKKLSPEEVAIARGIIKVKEADP